MVIGYKNQTNMNILKIKNGYQPGATRERTRFAFFPVIAMDVKIWFKWYTTTEVLTKVAGSKDDYEWEVISLTYW